MHLLSTKSQGAAIVRTPTMARDSARPSLMVSVIEHGTGRVVRGDHVMALHPGDIGLYVTDEPYRLEFSSGALRHTFQIHLDELGLPRELIASQLNDAVRPDRAPAAAISAFLRSAARNAPGATGGEQSALHQPTVDLIRLLLTRPLADAPVGREAHRLEEAARMLGDPAFALTTIADVAQRCGFSDHAHFSRAFRARFGASPSEWRGRFSQVT